MVLLNILLWIIKVNIIGFLKKDSTTEKKNYKKLKVSCPNKDTCTSLPCMHSILHSSNENCYAESICPDCKEDIKSLRKRKLKTLKRKSLN